MAEDVTPRLPGLFQTAPSARSKCRGCGQLIQRHELRFGERIPNPFAEGETTIWFHPLCAAYRRPEVLLAVLSQTSGDIAVKDDLERAARHSLEHPRLARIDGAERAPSSQAKCRCCRETIERGGWRIRLVFFADGMFSPGGYVHLKCAREYFETDDILAHAMHFSPGLGEAERNEVKAAIHHSSDSRPEGRA